MTFSFLNFIEGSVDDADGYFEDEYATDDAELYVSFGFDLVDTLF